MFTIVKDHGDYSFLIRNEYTGEEHEVTVAPHLRHLYDDKRIFSELPEICPFFRRNEEDGLGYCTVHLTRSDVCREYGCWRFLILDSQGKRAGRVMGSRHLHADDPLLRSVWDARVRPLIIDDDTLWDQKMREIIRSAGFDVRE